MARQNGAGIMAPPPRINAAQRRVNNQMAQSGQQPRVNAAERRMQNQGQAPSMPPQAQQRQPMPPQTGGGAQMQAPPPIPRPTGQGQFQTPPNFQPGQFPQMPQGWGQGVGNMFGGQQMIDRGFYGGYGMQPQFQQPMGQYQMGAGFPGGAPMQQGGFNWKARGGY